MKKYFKIHSVFIGAGIGFFSFYFIFHLWEMSWQISFLTAFTFGVLLTIFSFGDYKEYKNG
jgi:hypothetical protein